MPPLYLCNFLLGHHREAQPVGPYRLAGWSFGGVLAYEIAVQLIGADQRVEFLGLIDSSYVAGSMHSTESHSIEFDDRDQLVRIIEYAIRSNSTLNRNQRLQSALGEIKSKAKETDFARLVQRCQELSLLPETLRHLTVEQLRQRLVRGHYYNLAIIEYSAPPIPIPIHLFAATDNQAAAPLLGWKAVLPEDQIRLIPVPGTHLSMMTTPNIERLGQVLSRTIQSAAEYPGNPPDNNYSPLVALRDGRRQEATLFCVPGAGSSVSSLVDLVSNLSEKQQIFGFEPRGLDGVLIPHSTVPAAAESYLRAVREVYPKGPVHLFGHSFGGWVAFEMANRLIESGRAVVSLTILDSEAPGEFPLEVCEFNPIEVIMCWVEVFDLQLERPLGIRRSDLQSLSREAQIEVIHRRLVKERFIPRRSAPDILSGPLQTFARSLRTHFSPDQPYLGPTQLVLVDDPKLDPVANRRKHEQIEAGWKRWAPNLVLTHASGNHVTVLTPPHVSTLAQLMKTSMER